MRSNIAKTFQSLIGRLQTLATKPDTLVEGMFQSLIGRLQTASVDSTDFLR